LNRFKSDEDDAFTLSRRDKSGIWMEFAYMRHGLEAKDGHGPRVTIKDVAREVGVSTGLVSMALNDHPAVAVATKELVRRAARHLDYVPNSVGQALRARQLGAIAVVIPHSSHHVFSHPYFVEVLEGVTAVASAHDLTVVLSTSREEEDGEAAYVRLLRRRRADGVIVAAAAIGDLNIPRLAASGYPLVVLGRDPDPGISSVVVDDRGGAKDVVTHLLDIHARRRVAHIAGPLGHRSAVDKLEGYRAALEGRGLPYDPDLVAEEDYSEAGGARACEQLLAAGLGFDGLFAANDQMAFGALQTLRRHGLEVPRDLALAGFDDIELARVIQTPLTTMHQPMAEIGRRATERLIDLLNGRIVDPIQIELPTTLVIRESCGC